MLSAALGQDKFMSGLGIYLRQNAYSNTVPADLWQGLSSASNTDVAGLMNTWVTQPGFPLITVTESNKTISLEQHRFVSTGNLSTAADILYPVPIGLRTQHGVTRSVFSERTTTLELNDDMDFFYLNSDSMGYWRTKYTPDRLRKLGQQAKRLTVAERIGLVGDTSALVEAGHYNASAFLGLISQMKDEDDVFVWKPMIQEIKAYQSRWMGSTDIAGKLDELVRNITGSLADKLGQQSSNQSDYFQQQLYTTIFETAGLSGVPSIVQTSKSMLRDMVNNNASVANVSPLKDAAMAISLKHGGTEEVCIWHLQSRICMSANILCA
jgi:aminopeptidase 2